MKKIICAILLVAVLRPQFASAQESKDSLLVQRKFSIGLFISPNITYRTINYPKNAFSYTVNPDFGSGGSVYNTKFDKPDFNCGFGILFNQNLNKKLSIDFGLMRQTVSYKTGIVDTVISSWTYDRGGSTDTILNDVSFRFIYKSMSIPFSVLYVIKRTNKIAFCFGVGASVNFITNKEVTRNIVSSGDSRIYLMDYDSKEKLLYGLLKAKFSYSITRKIDISADPQFQYMINHFENELHLYSFILNTGINFYFNSK